VLDLVDDFPLVDVAPVVVHDLVDVFHRQLPDGLGVAVVDSRLDVTRDGVVDAVDADVPAHVHALVEDPVGRVVGELGVLLPEGPLVLVLHYRRVEQLRDILPIVVAGAGLVDQRVGVDRRSPSEVVGLLGDAYLGPRDGGPVGILDDHFEVARAMLLDAFVRGLGRVRRRPRRR